MALVLILAVGHDPSILNTRCAVLSSAGYVVLPAFSIGEAIDLFQDGDFDLLLLCHSIPIKDRDRLVKCIRSSGSQIPIYTVSSASTNFEAGLADGVLSSRPADLTEALGAVVAAHPHSANHAGQHSRATVRRTQSATEGRPPIQSEEQSKVFGTRS